MTFKRNPQFTPRIRKIAADRMEQSGLVVQKNIRALLDAPGSGEQYAGFPRRSSAPGKPPVSQSGSLSESIEVTPVTDDGQTLEVRIGSKDARARWFEAGTASIAPRPFLLLGLKLSTSEIRRIMEPVIV